MSDPSPPITWRLNHPRCAFCKYLRFDATPTRLGLSCPDYYKCILKQKIINYPAMPRPWCKCFDVKPINFDKEEKS